MNRALAAALAFALLATCLSASAAFEAPASADPPMRASAPAAQAQEPWAGGMPFVENRGQVGQGHVRYHTASGTIAFSDGAVWILAADGQGNGNALRLTFPGSRHSAPEGLAPSAWTASYFIGSEPEGWLTGTRGYGEVLYRGLWEGIDLVYTPCGAGAKYEFRLQPWADPGAIRIGVEGHTGLALGSAGEMVIGAGRCLDVVDSAPVAFHSDGTLAAASFAVLDSATYGFEVSGWDRSLPLTVDPMIFSTYLGGSGADSATAVAVDGGGCTYVAGMTHSPDFPSSPGAFSVDNDGLADAFVTKLDASGAPLYSAYIGGGEFDSARGIAVGSDGCAYITGETFSPDFPTTFVSLDRTYGGVGDAFVAKLTPAGDVLEYSTYIGGSHDDAPAGIAVDGQGAAYIAGTTWSSDFPATPGAFGANIAGDADIFVSKLTHMGDVLAYSTYLGGSGSDKPAAMALDGEGCVHVTGLTCSGDFPRTPGALNLSGGGLWNAFAARVNRLGNGLAHSALLGPGLDPKAVAVLGTSAAVAGTALGPADPSLQFSRQPAGGSDAFAMYLGESGEAVRATLLGGSGADSANAVAVGPDGRLHIAGETWSADFPRAGRQAPGLGGGDGFAARLDQNWTALEYCTAIGGTGPDAVAAMALSGNGCMHVAGCTWSSDLPVSALAHGTSAAGAGDGWSAALDMDAPRADAGPDLSVNESFALSFDGSRSTDNAAVVNYTWAVSDRDEDIILWGPAPNHTFREPGVYRVLLEVEDPAGNIDADEINVSVLVYPIPVAEAGPDVAADGQGVAVLDGSLSHDNVAVTDWTWSFDDGLNTVAASGERLEWRFRSPGTYVVNLTVSDADGNTDTDWMEITVADTACPIAALQASARVEPGTPVWLDASPSSDNEGIEEYIWSFSHNGTAVELRGMQASFEFWEPGNHTVLLTVRDRAGNEATNVMVVDVAAPGGGDAHISPLWALPALLAALAAALAYMLRGRGPGTGEVPP